MNDFPEAACLESANDFIYIALKEHAMAYGETVDLEFLGRQQAQLLEETRLLRQENREIRKSFVGISEHFSRQERRLSDLREDLESMIKVELGGSIANLETRMENYLERRLDEHGQEFKHLLDEQSQKFERILDEQGQKFKRGLDGQGQKLDTAMTAITAIDRKLDAVLQALTAQPR